MLRISAPAAPWVAQDELGNLCGPVTWFPQTLQAASRAQKIPEEHQKIIDQQRKNTKSLEDDDWGSTKKK